MLEDFNVSESTQSDEEHEPNAPASKVRLTG